MLCRLIVGLIACLSCWAMAAPEKGAKGVEVRFLAERVPGNLGRVLLVAEESRSEPFDLPVNNLSEPQEPPARAFGVVSVEHRAPVATIRLPDEGDSFIVLLVTKPAMDGYSVVTIPSSGPGFKGGDIYFHNNADKPVMGVVGTAKFTLDRREGKVLTPQGARQEGFYDVGLGVKEEGGNRLIKSTRWPEDKQARFYVFFYNDPKTKRITYRAVDEFLIPPELADPGR